ncbi:hypothetical protein PHYSODRAFT_490446 [Phytophthora sojae]|uniref:Transmembrane protein n=1 Tax=Phytophthora sojae (strain P6497) TaxID=1094619 RepID=G4Z3Y8_PHYSP|nr:hypothetical protein PHYSODRAFT_490446 [Phytophthora sojae]EGZ21540.1 hypothetical protein PHYSODRAFT_490446 [Phytophthora sojae]|eukprot:XP_009524257.1 hypothetical protein PHYSODRAFT_490446 [Phytophthora sojae]
MKRALAPAARLTALLGLNALDLLDLYGKAVWIGSTDSFSFRVVHEQGFAVEPLPRPAFLNSSSVEVGAAIIRASGWTSFYDRCSELYAPNDGEHFDMVKATDCDLRAPFSSSPHHFIPELVLSATLSADSVAWASCQLLFSHRRPQICQEKVVTQFPERYQWQVDEMEHDKMAPIHSMAEAELLKMLDLLSRSHPLSDVVCAQGFESTAGPGHYTATTFACGSPNVFESAFVGAYATSFAEFHEDLAGLAVDKLNVMGFELISRQNSRSQFVLREKDGEVVVVEENAVNFVTFGHLYVALIVTDIVLLFAHVRAAFDTSRMFGWRALVGFESLGDNVFSDSRWLLLYRSLYHSSAIVILTIFSAATSWFVSFPLAFMWCSNSEGSAYALLSAVRVWMFVLCLLNVFWGLFARLRESLAYRIVKCTFVTPLEVLLATTFVVILETDGLFGIAELRRHYEGQQNIDGAAFPGRLAVANAYNEEVDGFATTSPDMLHTLLSPFLIVVTESLALVVLVLLAKSMYYRRLLHLEEREAANAVAVVDNIDEHLDDPVPDQPASTAPLLNRPRAKLYHRLPLEELIRTPARVNSLVRCCFDVDVMEDDGLTYMLPHVYYDFGVMISDAGFLRTRRGFSNVIHRRLDVERFFAPTDSVSAVAPTPLKRQRNEVTDRGVKFALDSVPSPVDSVAAAQGSPSPPRTRSEFRTMPSARSMRRRKSMEELLDNLSPM